MPQNGSMNMTKTVIAEHAKMERKKSHHSLSQTMSNGITKDTDFRYNPE